jgi:malate dehydrogenase (oxaloacetate-decarboxylating)
VRTVELIAPGFGGINLEDIAAPRCFEIEARLREKLDIPVFHDDQHGTAIVALAACATRCASSTSSWRT